MSLFDAKNFNGEVFQKYLETIPNTKRNELIKSRAIRQRPDLAQAMADQTGGNYITTPLLGLISGTAPQNYDGSTDLTANNTDTYTHSRVVVGRANAWTERDFSYDITGGVDFMENVARQISEYWDEVDQATIIHILNGLFKMNDDKGLEFVQSHTHNICAVQNSENVTGHMDGTTLNTAMQKACGDNKSKFSLALMHSVVATNLENLKILVYFKYNDDNGMERDAAIATLNGRLVLIDDGMPTAETTTTAETCGVYTVTISTALAAGEKVTICGVEYTAPETPGSATAQATSIETLLKANTGVTNAYTITRNNAVLTFTEKTGHGGTGAPAVDNSGLVTGVVASATTTAGVAKVTQTAYTTYVLGEGAIEFTDCGAKVPYEMDRNPAKFGGQDTLYSRQRKSFAPYGINFTKDSMSGLSPTDAELETGSNWMLVNNGQAGASKKFIDPKAIAIARIISLG